ncbi:LysR substrate-binding domain-containing protein [Achromobacter aegrifaciens]|uniref:LysR substrate-binding domain-containing protein n=1 Tax=Achromobacter aegrifaciens TaxID=1287736 RepID=UPI0028A6A8A2|nr:LysR substrate-binding domain-containing protein [Achromobacter aegrifaciens]
MDTTFLLNFIQVIEQGSIAEVARKNGLTPAAINQRIKKVEDELGFKLVVRSGRTVKPTVEGAQILAQAKHVMEEVRNLKAASQGPVVFGHLTLGAFDSAMTTLMPTLLARLIDRHPNLEISLVKGYSVNLYSKICDGEMDAALILQPQFQMPKNLEWRRVRDEPLVVLAPASLAETDPHQLLRANPLICYDRKLWGGQLAANYFRQHSIRPKIRIETASIEVIALLVGQGLGVSLVPDGAGELRPDSGLRKIPLPDDEHFRSVGLLWNRQSVRAALIEEIYEIARAA